MGESDQEESARELLALTTLDGAVSSGGTLAPETELKDTEGLSVLPASTAGLLALLERHKVEPLPSDRYVAVITGRRS